MTVKKFLSNRPFRAILRAAAICTALCLTLTACGASSAAPSQSSAAVYDAAEEKASDAYSVGTTGDAGAAAGGDSALYPQGAAEGRKIIYTADLYMESTDFDTARTALLDAVTECGGYLESTDQGGRAESGSRYISCTARIPTDRYRKFLEFAGECGSVRSLSENTQDITTSYVDVEARLTALKAQRDRLNALAEKAETTSDLLEIESQLSDVQYQIESYTAKLRVMDDQVECSTVNIYLDEVRSLTPTPVTFGEQLLTAVQRGWNDAVDGVQGLIIGLVSIWPLLILLAVVLVILRLTRPWRRARKAKPCGKLKQDLDAPQEPENK